VSPSDFILIIALVAALVYLVDGMRAREIATAVARDYCKQADLQFLDGTVSLRSIRLNRDIGRMRIERRFEFHYTDSSHERRRGLVVLVGRKVIHFVLHDQALHPVDERTL